jgi:uncharacterized protein
MKLQHEVALAQPRWWLAGSLLILAGAGGLIFWGIRASGSSFEASVFLTALCIGIFAQLIDGAMGMAYGITATSLLLSMGVPPVAATAAVHISEVFTTGASGLSHWRMQNVDRRLFRRLVIPGVVGAVCGVLLVTSIDGQALRPWVSAYLLLMGAYLLYRAIRFVQQQRSAATPPQHQLIPLAFTGAFVDSVGGGGWGPVVTSTLLVSGREPRTTIGTVNSSEFFITLASGFSFALLVGITHWEVIAGLICGGMLAAPFAAQLTRRIPVRPMMLLVGLLVIGLSVWNLSRAWF